MADQSPLRGAGVPPARESASLSGFSIQGRQRLGAILVTNGLLTEEQLTEAPLAKKESNERLGQIVVRLKMVDEEALGRAFASQHGLEFLNLAASPPNATSVRLLPERYVSQHKALSVRFMQGGSILVAVADLNDVVALDVIKFATGSAVQLAVSTASDIDAAIARMYDDGENDDDPDGPGVDSSAGGIDKPELAGVRDSADSAPAAEFVNRVLKRVVEEHASDIHFEPQDDQLVVRARIDGVAHQGRRHAVDPDAGRIRPTQDHGRSRYHGASSGAGWPHHHLLGRLSDRPAYRGLAYLVWRTGRHPHPLSLDGCARASAAWNVGRNCGQVRASPQAAVRRGSGVRPDRHRVRPQPSTPDSRC